MVETPIYEVLRPGDCYVLEKRGDRLLTVCNRGGRIAVRWTRRTRSAN